MNIVFISYWGLQDPLCVSTVLPHVEILSTHPRIESVHLVTFEREENPQAKLGPGIQHHVVRQPSTLGGLGFFLSYLSGIACLLRIRLKNKIDLIVCRSIFAGFLGHLFFKLFGTKYTVESYEPHAQYMVENGVWAKGSWKESMILWWDRMVKSSAFKLYPVSNGYARVLLDEGLSLERVEVLPCTVDASQFRFSTEGRNRTRASLGLPPNATACIYVGKFGGMYLDEETLPFLEGLAEQIPDLYLILLSDPESTTVRKLKTSSILSEWLRVLQVSPEEVPDHLSAADFALVLTRPTNTSRYLSPIKIGEYLTNGLPIVMSVGIGDDSQEVANHNLGVVLPCHEKITKNDVHRLVELIQERRDGSSKIPEAGQKLRGRQLSKKCYDDLIDSIRDEAH